jgi:hypothetical protein
MMKPLLKSELLKAIDDLKNVCNTIKTTTDTSYKGHLLLSLERMKSEKTKPTLQVPPPGLIGCGVE